MNLPSPAFAHALIRKRYLDFYLLITLLLAVSVSSCSNPPESVEHVLKMAGSNRKELQDVIDHYKKTGESEKLNAAYFLIGNMSDKYSYDGPNVTKYDAIFSVLDSMNKRRPKPDKIEYQNKWDSIVSKNGRPILNRSEKKDDIEYVKSKYLIENIDAAFKAWKEAPWGKKLKFEDFCEFILPYRIGTERLETWRPRLYSKFKGLRDSMQAKNSFGLAEKLNYKLKELVNTNQTMWGYPFDMPASKMELGKKGACSHVTYYTTMVMRALGLPVTIDEVPLWGNRDNGHMWNCLLMEDGKFYSFNGAKGPLEGHKMFVYKPAKVFRRTFVNTKPEHGNDTEDIPANLLKDREHQIDVTDEYSKTYNLQIPIKMPLEEKIKHALLCTYGHKTWEVQDWGSVENNKATFRKVGSDILYMIMYKHRSLLIALTPPFILQKDGHLRFLNPDETNYENVTLYRKYPIFDPQKLNLEQLIGGRFQAANKADFSDSVTLFTLTDMAHKLESVPTSSSKKFRFVRFLSTNNQTANVAELEFLTGKNGQLKKLCGKIIGTQSKHRNYLLSKAFDGDLGTYFSGNTSGIHWVGLELDKPSSVSRIRYCPQNDTNFIIVGNIYELYYWNNRTGWASLGKKTATDQVMEYDNVPSRGLYILRCLSGGNEERVFTYENGKQMWW